MAIDRRDGWLGKLASLGYLLVNHSAAAEADLLQYYSRRIEDCSVRLLWVLLSQLPQQARTLRLIDEAAEWSTTDYLLAAVIDHVAWNTWVLSAVNSKTAPRKPEPVERPGGRKKPTQPISSGLSVASFLKG